MLCGGNTGVIKDYFIFESKSIGSILVPNIEFEFCPQCGERLVSGSEGEKILDFVRNKEEETVRSIPVRHFVTAAQAAKILGVTKQAFSKNKKVKRGMIFNILLGSRKLYLKKSVELFKECDNGIFLLTQEQEYKRNVATTRTRKPFVTNTIVYGKQTQAESEAFQEAGYVHTQDVESSVTVH